MEIEEVTDEEFSKIISRPYHTFGSGPFANINKGKVDKVCYLLFKDGKYRLGLTAGIRENIFHTPFSSPFGGFIFLNDDIKIKFIDDAINKLTEWCMKRNFNSINFTIPPKIYHHSFLSKQANSLFRNGFIIEKIDLNYSFDLKYFNKNYIQDIWHNARKNLKIAFTYEFTFKKCNSIEENRIAYEVIKKNRELRGFPLRMSWNEIVATTSIIPYDFFLIYNSNNIPIASAIVFHVSAEIVQVIYWGDLPEFNGLKTMNYLSYKIFEYYKSMDIRIVDIGPSTENSVPNYGLCEFKESIGCQIDEKFSFTKKLN